MANQVCGEDLGTQGADRDSADTHAMSPRKEDGRQESCQHAYEGTKQQIGRDIDSGDLAKALHTIEDATATAHRGYQPWDGEYGPLHLPGPAHTILDNYPLSKDTHEGYENALKFLKDYMQHGHIQWTHPITCRSHPCD